MIDYNERIPNNVNLAEDKVLQRALEKWQPGFQNWWGGMGPAESSDLIRERSQLGDTVRRIKD